MRLLHALRVAGLVRAPVSANSRLFRPILLVQRGSGLDMEINVVIARVWQTAMTTDRVETLFVHGEARLISMYYIVYRQPDLGRMPEKERLADLLPRPLCPIQKSLRGRRKSGIWRFPVLWIVGRRSLGGCGKAGQWECAVHRRKYRYLAMIRAPVRCGAQRTAH